MRVLDTQRVQDGAQNAPFIHKRVILNIQTCKHSDHVSEVNKTNVLFKMSPLLHYIVPLGSVHGATLHSQMTSRRVSAFSTVLSLDPRHHAEPQNMVQGGLGTVYMVGAILSDSLKIHVDS